MASSRVLNVCNALRCQSSPTFKGKSSANLSSISISFAWMTGASAEVAITSHSGQCAPVGAMSPTVSMVNMRAPRLGSFHTFFD